MNLDESLFKEALKIQNFDFKDNVIKVTDKTIDFFESINLPQDLIIFFKTFSFREEIKFGSICFNCVNRIRTENLEQENKEIYKKKLLHEALESEVYKKIKENFPDAELSDVEEVK